MADLSLDEYITKKKPNIQFSKRIGQKVSPGKAGLKITNKSVTQQRSNVSPRFKVVGLGSVKVNFDARQKLSRKQANVQIKDAREKIIQKTRLADARLRIQRKVGTLSQPMNKTVPSVQGNNQTVQVKVTNVQSKPVDARHMIKTKQQNRAKNQPQLQRTFQAQPQGVTTGQVVKGPSNPKVTITGLGQMSGQQGSNRQQLGGAASGGIIRRVGTNLQVVSNSPPEFNYQKASVIQRNIAVRKTIENVGYIQPPTSRLSNNIVISPQDPPIVRQRTAPVSQPDYESYTDVSYEEPTMAHYQHYNNPVQQQDANMVHVQNDVYRQPVQATVPHQVVSPPSYQQNYYTEPSAPVVASTPAPVLRSPLDRPARPSQTTSSLSMIQSRLGEDPNAVSTVADVSPLQGYRVLISNLHTIVTQDDILELFGAVGALKKVRLLRAGTAEVVFVKKDDALAAIRKYNNRELDGQPMKVVLTSSSGTSPAHPTNQPVKPEISRLQKVSTAEPPAESSSVAEVDLSLLHKALFKTTSKDDPPSRPVTFTVKI